jgi:hypothetical protein
MLKRVCYIVSALLLIWLLCGCSSDVQLEDENTANNGPAKAQAKVVVTRGFGKELILEQEVGIEADTTALAALQIVAEVETKYGGGFIASINGISSEYGGANGGKKDWFVYINGIQSNVGAADYHLKDGDIEHWDFRDWNYQMSVPAIIGDFPQPFLSGFQEKIKPTSVVYEDLFSSEAEALVENLKGYGVTGVSAVQCDILSDETKADNNLIIIALPDNRLIKELNDAHKKLGFYLNIQQSELIVLDAEGNISGKFGEGSSLIQATQNPWYPEGIGSGENVVWMITGTDKDGVRSAVEVLVTYPDKLKYACSVMINEGKVIKVP